MIHFRMLCRSSAKDRFQIREVGDIDNLIDAESKRAHGIVGGEAMRQKHDKMFATIRSRASTEFS